MDESSIDMFIQTIFDSNESNWKLSDKIPLVRKAIEEQKSDLLAFLHSNSADLPAILEESKDLCLESNSLVEEMLECKKQIAEETLAKVVGAIEKHARIFNELEEANFRCETVQEALLCIDYIREFESIEKEKYKLDRAVEIVYDLLTLVQCPSEGFRDTEMYTVIKQVTSRIGESTMNVLFSTWDSIFLFSTEVGTRKTVVKLKITPGDDKIYYDVINAMKQCKKLAGKVTELGKLIMKEFINPIIHQVCRIVADLKDGLSLTIIHEDNNKPKYTDVLLHLKTLFQYLSVKLSIDLSPRLTLLELVAERFSTEFKDTLVRDCLIDTVPNKIQELLNYDEIIANISEFQKELVEMKVYREGSFDLLDYASEVEVIFAKKASRHYLETARTIMLKDLSETMSIGVESIPEDTKTNDVMDESTENALKILDKTIPKSLFYFPRCLISKSAQELLDFIDDIMEETEQCSEMLQKRFYCTTRLVFELYDAVVPYHHEKYLQTIPQYVALFHNNCMYLAHNLQLLGDKWRCMMNSEDQAVSFLDLVQPLRDLGYRHLAAHLQYQRKQILDNIRSSDLNSIGMKDSLGPDAEAAVRQCLRQLALLNSVWVGVLPNNVFTKLMATLTHMFVSELIHRVVSVEDVSAEMATQLTNIYSLVVQKAPALFQNLSDVETHVKSWPKLHELIFVLGGTLKDLEARWADGSGPLAQHFTTDELRNLIKALFQNTQFRANLLAKIK